MGEILEVLLAEALRGAPGEVLAGQEEGLGADLEVGRVEAPEMEVKLELPMHGMEKKVGPTWGLKLHLHGGVVLITACPAICQDRWVSAREVKVEVDPRENGTGEQGGWSVCLVHSRCPIFRK